MWLTDVATPCNHHLEQLVKVKLRPCLIILHTKEAENFVQLLDIHLLGEQPLESIVVEDSFAPRRSSYARYHMVMADWV